MAIVKVVLTDTDWDNGYSNSEIASVLEVVATSLKFGHQHGDYLGTKWELEDDDE